MKLLYGTGNPAKLASMREKLKDLDIQLIGLKDLSREIPGVPEGGNTPLENARLKAQAYYNAFHMPVFSCDSGLYFDNVPDEVQPGVNVRRVGGRCLTDEEMMEYYSSLASRYGDLTARYQNAICLIMDEDHKYASMVKSLEERFIITSKPHRIRKEGFPLDSLSIDITTGKYYYDLQKDKSDKSESPSGFTDFFKEVMKKIG